MCEEGSYCRVRGNAHAQSMGTMSWGPGACLRALVGSRGEAPVGVQEAKPPEALRS